MGLFGVFATIFSGGVLLAETVKESNYAANQREQARKEGKVTYGVNGHDYLTSTGEQVFVRGGKVYSMKNHGVVLHDMNMEYYNGRNEENIQKAKEKDKKYAMYYFPDVNAERGYSCHNIELATMKRYQVDVIVYMNKEIHNWDFGFYKQYYTDNGERLESVKITRKEFEELGGYLPYRITPLEYEEKKRIEREKFLKKVMRG